MGKPMGQHPNPITYSQKPKRDPKVGRDPVISASSCAPPLIGCQRPKIDHYDQESPKTWSRANNSPVEAHVSSMITR
jgi:hypothetical protein